MGKPAVGWTRRMGLTLLSAGGMLRSMLSAYGWRNEEKSTRLENVAAMPRAFRHDEGLTRLKIHSRLRDAFSCERDSETPFEQIQRFISSWMPFPMVGMDRLIVHGNYSSHDPVRRGLCPLVQRNARGALISAERNQFIAQIERHVCLHGIDLRVG